MHFSHRDPGYVRTCLSEMTSGGKECSGFPSLIDMSVYSMGWTTYECHIHGM